MAQTTVTQVPHAINNFYSRVMLERAVPNLVHALFGQVKDIPRNNSNVIKFRRYGALAVATTALTEGTTPSSTQLSITDITATVAQYGAYVELSDWLQITTPDPILTETAEVLGEQAGQTMDIIIRDVLVAGTNVQYADAVAGRSSVAASNKIDTADIRKVVRTLKNANAKRITRMVSADTGYNTTPVDEAFVAIVHPNTTYDLKGLTEFVPIEKYAGMLKQRLPGEVGKVDEVRFVESTHAKVFTGAGDSSIDVYATLFFGMDAYGVSHIGGESLKNIVKPLGSAGTADPLDQRSTSGWKATLVAVILNQTWMVRYEHAVS